jgi:hypothetical protein
VLEHLNLETQIEALEKFTSVLKEDGRLIISVPIEVGFPSVVKNIRRNTFNGISKTYTLKNTIASFLGRKTKHMKSHRQKEGSLSHLGFFHGDLEKVFLNYFKILKKSFSPFKGLGLNLNSQVFYELKIRSRKS